MSGLLAAASLPMTAAQTNFDAGSAIAPWIRADQDARVAGMGGAGRATANNVQALTHNPAGLGQSEGSQLAVQQQVGIEGTSRQRAAVSGSLFGLGLGVGLDNYNFGEVQTTSVSGGILTQGGIVRPGGYAINIGAGLALPMNLGIGATIRHVEEDLAGSKTVFDAFTAGLNYSMGDLRLGAVYSNGAMGSKSNLPTSIDLGAAYGLALSDSISANIVADASFPTYATNAAVYAGGLELQAMEHYLIRGGYRYAGNGGISGASAGAGYQRGILGLDYAFVMEGDLGNAHQISLSARF